MFDHQAHYTMDPWQQPDLHIEQIGHKFCVINALGLIVREFPTRESARQWLNLDLEEAQ